MMMVILIPFIVTNVIKTTTITITITITINQLFCLRTNLFNNLSKNTKN